MTQIDKLVKPCADPLIVRQVCIVCVLMLNIHMHNNTYLHQPAHNCSSYPCVDPLLVRQGLYCVCVCVCMFVYIYVCARVQMYVCACVHERVSLKV